MSTIEHIENPHVTTIEVDGRRYNVSLEIGFDGIEFVGHLWFSDEAWDEDEGVRDHGTIPGRQREEVGDHARRIGEQELVQRYRRAIALFDGEHQFHHGLARAYLHLGEYRKAGEALRHAQALASPNLAQRYQAKLDLLRRKGL